MKIIYMGTPDFAVLPLKSLIEAGENIVGVFTQPDRPKGRGFKMLPPPVKTVALENNIPVYQPTSFKVGDDAAVAEKTIRDLDGDIIVVAAYGKLLPKIILDIPKYGCINIHASLLPRYRGAAPIQRAVLNGEKESGVTIQQMAEGLDTGDMLSSSTVEIGENMTASDLHDELSKIGAELIVRTVRDIQNGNINPQKQDDNLSNYAEKIDKAMCITDFSRTALEVHNHIRGLSYFPGAITYVNGKRLKMFRSEVVTGVNGKYGEIIDENQFIISCGDGNGIRLNEVQIEGGKRMNTKDFLRGNKINKGDILQ